ncbi:MucR family transcriptional regulator [Solidesulfovibrio sp.]|jgi:predicted transcriptional regulator|uniref:MucR family transcriptional regulator n=1 Tax=Solidesulfovibrio sp. TaxID=2910990 RepID=UPI000EDA8E89|nr:MucR family transcriptional regulator [Solidesulfovibrio sp.]MEA5090173.1 MucR family transcriptional regulator [Solidesulfovibrio sp.]HCR13228.1 transcriptional regulator [Desulfovibrio sp.]HML60832.1 MucR family transcriptional regulator [Solidesulfovibrio sp.]
MEEYVKCALEIVKAQASVRTMTDEEITSMVRRLAAGIRDISGDVLEGEAEQVVDMDPKKAVKEKSVTCLECGKSFKVITKKHLATHGLTPEEYKAKHGYKKTMPLVCKSLQRDRRKKMKDMRLWEKKGKVVA